MPVGPREFEKLAEQAGLAKALVRHRVPELAETVLNTIKGLAVPNEVARNVASFVRKRSETVVSRLRS